MSISRRIRALLFENFWLKVISLVFAAVLFVIVRTEQVREFSVTGKIRIITNNEMVVVGAKERAIELQVKLPNSLFSLPPNDDELTGVLDLSEQAVGRIRVRLSRYNFPNLDERYSVTVLDPWIEVDLDEVITKAVSVRAVLQGLPAQGLSIERVIVNPEDIQVKGARTELESLETLSTSPVNIDGIDQNFSAITKIALNDTSSLSVASDKVNVQVFVGRYKRNRVFQRVPVAIRNAGGASYQVSPSTILVELRGAEEVTKKLSNEGISAFVDVSEMTSTSSLLKVWLKIPSETSLVRVEPDKVRVLRK